MGVGRAVSVALQGLDGVIVEVEADVGRGLPGMHIGGLGDAAVAEAPVDVAAATCGSMMRTLPAPSANSSVSSPVPPVNDRWLNDSSCAPSWPTTSTLTCWSPRRPR